MQPEDTNTITSQNIAPVNPLELPEAPVDTSAQQFVQSEGLRAQQELLKRTQTAQQERKDQTSDITKLMQDIGAVEGTRESIANSLGSNKFQKQVDDLQSEIDIESRSLKRDTDALYANPNLSASLASRRANEQARKSASYVADLSVAQQVLSRNYDRAIETANRKVDMQLAPLKQNLDALKFTFDANKDRWSTVEKAELQGIINQEERAYKKEEENRKGAEEMRVNILRNQAPQSIKSAMQGVETVDDMLKIPGIEKYLMSPEEKLDLSIKRAQLSKLNTELSQKNPDAGELVKINGSDYIRYKDGTISEPVLPGANDLKIVSTRLGSKIDTLSKLTDPSVGLATSAGSVRGAPVPFLFKGKINDWRADVINTVQKLTVDELGRVKSDGVTFGALSNGERQAVGDAATALSAAMIYSGSGDDKRPTGRFKMSEQKVVEELKKIQDGYKLDFEKRMGVSYDDYQNNPEIIKSKIADDFIDSASEALQDANYGGYSIN